MLALTWSDPNIKYIGCTYCKYSLSSSPASMQRVHTFHTHRCTHSYTHSAHMPPIPPWHTYCTHNGCFKFGLLVSATSGWPWRTYTMQPVVDTGNGHIQAGAWHHQGLHHAPLQSAHQRPESALLA